MTGRLDDLNLVASGKVREMYEVDGDLLMVASDRISAYDVVLPTPIPDKGRVLTQMSVFWFETTGQICPNHYVSQEVPADAEGRGLRVQKLDMYPVECVARGYLSGSGWREYQASGAVCGIELPEGLRESDQLPEPIFTPATKAEVGDHDENIDFERAVELVGDRALMEELRRVTIELYEHAAAHARERGIIIADTKFEFGSSAGRRGRARRRGPDPGLVALLARRPVRARSLAGLVRQAVRARLARRLRLGPQPAGPRAPARRRRRHPRQVRRGLRADHRPRARLATLEPYPGPMNLFVLGLRRSGTTILYDALREDPGLRCFYEPLREDAETVGGGSGARDEDVFAETRELRERFRDAEFPELPIERFNWGGPRAPELELDSELPEHCRGLLAHLLSQAPDVAIKETRLHHKLGALAELDPEAAVVHLVRDPRAVTASMLLGRRGRTDIYPDADTFFTARTGRRLWSSRRISTEVATRRRSLDLRSDIPDFLRPLLVWKAAFETTAGDGERRFGERYALVRLEDLRADPRRELERIYALTGRPLPEAVADWAAANIRRDAEIRFADDPRWARAARVIGAENELERAGYGEILALDPDGEPLDLTPPPARSRLSGFIGRAKRRLA